MWNLRKMIGSSEPAMSTITVTLPDQLKKSVEDMAQRENVSTDEFICMALAAKVSQVDQLAYLKMRAARGNREAFLRVLNNAPEVKSDEGDELE